MYWRTAGLIILIIFTLPFSTRNVNGQIATEQLKRELLGQVNECPEGQFLDLGSGTCRNLVKEFGFRPFQPRPFAGEVSLSQCKYTALANLVDQMGRSGGTILLPPCIIEIDKPLTIPDNTILQGVGIGKTILIAAKGFEGNMLRIKQAENVIIRDLTLDGNRTYSTNILINSARNVLLERIEAHNTKRTGITFRYTRNITIRYSASHDHATWHGIGSKDCFPKGDTDELKECELAAGDVSPGSLWSQNYAIYSNRLYKNADYGLDSHASYGEIAGNVIIGNERGTKFPDASQLWIHHNLIADNNDWGTRVYSTLKIPEKRPRQIVYFENLFQANRGYPVNLSNPTSNLYLIANRYLGNQPQRLSISEAEVYTCPGTQDSQIAIRGRALRLTSNAKCNLENIEQIFEDTVVDPINPIPTPVPEPDPDPGLAPANRIYLPGRIEAEDYLDGGEGIGYFDSTIGNAGGAYRNDHVDIETSASGDSAHEIGWIEAGEWLAYEVFVTETGDYRFSARVTTWGKDKRALHIEVDGQNVTGSLRFDASFGNRVWVNAVADGIHLDAGKHQIRVVMETSKFNLNYIDVTAERFTSVSRILLPLIRR